MNNLLRNAPLVYKALIGALVALVVIVIAMIILVIQQDTTNDLDFNISINQDATPLTVADYAEWACNGFDVELPESFSYHDLKQAFQTLLDDWQTKRPPQELLAHYTNEKNMLVELVNMLNNQNKQDQTVVDGTEYGLTIAYRWQIIDNRYAIERNKIVKNIPQQVRKELVDLGCYLL